MFDFIKKLLFGTPVVPMPDPIPGQIYERKEIKNPFNYYYDILILDVKNGYHKYCFIDNKGKRLSLDWSDSNEDLHILYKLKSPNSLEKK